MKLKPDPTLRQRMDSLTDEVSEISAAPLMQRPAQYLKLIPAILVILNELVKRAEAET